MNLKDSDLEKLGELTRIDGTKSTVGHQIRRAIKEYLDRRGPEITKRKRVRSAVKEKGGKVIRMGVL